jgi:hypothetical protein
MAKSIFDISKEFGLHPKVVLAKARELGIAQAKVVSSLLDDNDTARLEKELLKASSQQMKPRLKNCRLIEVQAGKTWKAALEHRVYSCPDTPTYDFVLGATALLLNCNSTGRRVLLNVEAVQVCDLSVPNFLETVPDKFRARLSSYKNEAQNISGILDSDYNHRFYFLTTEPWPDEMQEQTTPASTPPTEWSAILSILTDPEQFFQWPQLGALLWPGCVRTRNDGEHIYPAELITHLERLGIKPDTRTNGPAIVSFLAAGGKRPNWGNEGWHIHHIFDGTEGAPHAVHDGNLFTHSAGLVAAHPVAHHLVHQSGLLKWLLRREAFLRFGFDPKRDFVDV